MKNPWSLVASAVTTLFTSVALSSSLSSHIVPAFPLDADGRIEITGTGRSELKREEMMPLVMEWIHSHMDDFAVEEDADTGIIKVTGTFLIADAELYEGTRTMECMEYSVAVACSDNAFSYRIGDANVYVATVFWPYGFVPAESTSYDILEISRIEIPDDYIMLIDESHGQRGEIRQRLEELLAQDMTEASRGKRRRYERELEETAAWFADTDEYYRIVRENYMACYDFLTRMASSIEELLGGEAVEEVSISVI